MLPPNPTAAPRGGGAWREDLTLERIAALLRSAFPGHDAALDDAAVLGAPDGDLLVCADAAVEGVHVDRARFPAEDLGYRAVAATLSDLAACGGRPLGVTVAICARGDEDLEAIERGAVEACVASGCAIVGGNLSTAGTTSVVASAVGVVPTGTAVRRNGARPGDALFVTGRLGASAAGRRARVAGAALDDALVAAHRHPVPRLREGSAARSAGATAMLDVSDGLARDLRRLVAASSVGAALDVVPVADGATLDDALGGGEDYELLFAHRDPAALADAFERAGLAAPIRVGTITSSREVTLDGAPLADVGWRHGAPGDQEPR